MKISYFRSFRTHGLTFYLTSVHQVAGPLTFPIATVVCSCLFLHHFSFSPSRRMSDADVERVYGRCRKRHPGPDYTQHLAEYGPQNMVDFGQLPHSFMDYFDMAAPLLCARIVDVVDQINNGGRPMSEYYFWPDVQVGGGASRLNLILPRCLRGLIPAC